MAYVTATDLKLYLHIEEATDDVLLASLISRATAIIDSYCGFSFEASADTSRTFDAMLDTDGWLLVLDRPLTSVTSITNGDATTVTASQYVTEPRNDAPFWGIRIRSDATIAWEYGDYYEDAITVTGKWAYSTSAPADIQHATLRLAGFLYRQPENAGELDRTIIAGNATVLPAQLPADVRQILDPYKRVGVG